MTSYAPANERAPSSRSIVPASSVNEKILSTPTAGTDPFMDYRIQDVGNIRAYITNYGIIGAIVDPQFASVTSLREYPKGSRHLYPSPLVAIGGFVGMDTLVTRGLEFAPLPREEQIVHGDTFTVRSITDNVFPNPAHSEQDISCMYYDTISSIRLRQFDNVDKREHRPLGLEVHLTSYAWSLTYADDFILFDYKIINVSNKIVKSCYMGIENAGFVGSLRVDPDVEGDDISGYIPTATMSDPKDSTCTFSAPLNLAWKADNNGNPNPLSHQFDDLSPRAVMGTRILRPATAFNKFSFNWWDGFRANGRDFSPRRAGTSTRPFHDFAGGNMGEPLGDRDLYYVMSSGEVDYSQLFTAKDHTGGGWLPPPPGANRIAGGGNVETLLSIGPFDLKPGESIPFTFAWVGGENFHTSPTNYEDNWDPYNPQPFIDNLDFSELIKNATWAGWVYDNPGFDTDGDGYKGRFHVCVTDSRAVTDTSFVVNNNANPPETTFVVDTLTFVTNADTIYYTGDGVPDFRAAAPPPAPQPRINPSFGKLEILWNGLQSETTPDIFTHELDFEGYRVYLGLTPRRSDMSLLSSFDLEDYNLFLSNVFGARTRG